MRPSVHIQADAPPVEMHVTRQLHSPGSGGERPAPRWSLMRADGTLLQPNRTNPPSAENSMKTDPKYKKKDFAAQYWRMWSLWVRGEVCTSEVTHSEFTKRLDGQHSCFSLLLEVQNICTAGLKYINITILFKDLCDGIPVVYNEELKPVFSKLKCTNFV